MTNDLPIARIGIAVVEQDNCFLVGVRPEGVPLAGYAEFPGGKCGPNEPPRECAVRECHEETGLEVIADELLMTCRHAYPHGDVELHFWRCQPMSSVGESLPTGTFRWTPRSLLNDLRFPDANAAVLKMLTTR